MHTKNMNLNKHNINLLVNDKNRKTFAAMVTNRIWHEGAYLYVNQFRDKWINNNTSSSVLGAGDIQSLADLGNSFEVTRDMGIMPCTFRPVLQIVFVCSLPFLPLILTLIPIEAIVKGVVMVFI